MFATLLSRTGEEISWVEGVLITQVKKRRADLMKGILRIKHDPLVRFRTLWTIIGLLIGIVLTGQGAGYAFDHGFLVSRYPLLGEFPGSLHAHGYICFALGISLVASFGAMTAKVEKWTWTVVKGTLLLTALYTVWCTYAFCVAWGSNRHYTPNIWWYLLVVGLTAVLFLLPPPFDPVTGRGIGEGDRA